MQAGDEPCFVGSAQAKKGRANRDGPYVLTGEALDAWHEVMAEHARPA
jgi:hypothetical protein